VSPVLQTELNVTYKSHKLVVLQDSSFNRESVPPALQISPLVLTQPTELLVIQDSIYPLHGLIVLLVHHQLLPVPQPPLSYHVYLLSIQLQFKDQPFHVPLVQLLEASSTVTMLLMLLVV